MRTESTEKGLAKRVVLGSRSLSCRDGVNLGPCRQTHSLFHLFVHSFPLQILGSSLPVGQVLEAQPRALT